MKDKHEWKMDILFSLIDHDKHIFRVSHYFGESLYGISIIKEKYSKKRKVKNYEHLLLDIKELKRIADVILNYDYTRSCFMCTCGAEVLKLTKFVWSDGSIDWEMTIYDNYYLKCPKGVEYMISATDEQMKNFAKFLQELKDE